MRRSTNILLSIIKEIGKDCATLNLQLPEEFLEFYVKLTILDPAWNVSLYSDEIVRINVQNLIKHIVRQLKYPTCPCMITLRMQIFMIRNRGSLIQSAEKNFDYLRQQLSPLQTDIVESLAPTSQEEKDLLYKKIVYYITLVKGMGNPGITEVFIEAKQALLSVMQEADLMEFLNQMSQKKIDDLKELGKIIVGIRLFNRDCKKGGYGIEDLPKLLEQSLQIICKESQNRLEGTLATIYMITTAIEECFKLEWKEALSNYVLYYELPEGVEYEDMEYAKDILVTFRQYEVYLRYILTQITKIEKNIEKLNDDFKASLTDIHHTVDLMYAVLTDIVFPKFIACYEVWRELQCQTLMLTRLNEIQMRMEEEINQITINYEVLALMLGVKEVQTDEDRLNSLAGQKIEISESFSKVLHPSSQDSLKLPIEYLGFCAWKIVETQGGLIPGNTNIGVCEYKGRYYSFSSIEAAGAFAKEPEKYTKLVMEICRKKPELINLLNIEDQLHACQHKKQLYKQPKPVVVNQTAGVQTDIHPIESHIDVKYKWNIWDYKRQALTLANNSRMLTHSTQTDASTCRAVIGVQTQDMREKTTQTKVDNYTNVPTLSNFLYGLRGRKDDKQCIIDLTRPPKE